MLTRLTTLLLPILCFHSTLLFAQSPADALALEQQGKFTEAAEAWRAVTKANPRDAAAFASMGLDLSRQEKYAEAAAAYRRAIALNPRLPGIQLNLGLAEFKQGKFAAAIPPLRAASIESQSDQPQMLLGLSYYGAKQFSDAVKTLKPLAAADPGNAELGRILAQSCLQAKQYSCAMDEFKKLLSRDPDSAPTHILMGEALDGVGRTNDAIAEFKSAAQISPSEPEVHFGLGYLYWKSHQYDDAKRELEAELALNPGHAQALAYLGDIALKQNQFPEETAALLEQAIAKESGIRIAYLDLGAVRAEQKEYSAAVKALTRAVELDPTEPDAHYRLGRIYKAMGNNPAAEKEFAKTRELHQKADAAVQVKVPAPAVNQ